MAENKTIITSLLKQCVWMWENCIRNNEVGEFRLNEIIPAKGSKTKRAGHVFTDLDMCRHWELFGTKFYPVEGMQWNERDRSVRLTFDNFSCGYKLKDVLPITLKYIKTCMPSMLNKVLFCTDGKERWVSYSEKAMKAMSDVRGKKTENGNVNVNDNPQPSYISPQPSYISHEPEAQPSFAELLRKVLLAA